LAGPWYAAFFSHNIGGLVSASAQRRKAAKAQRKDMMSSLLVFRQSVDDSDNSVTNELGVEFDDESKSHSGQVEI
jgi:hypothetical protein